MSSYLFVYGTLQTDFKTEPSQFLNKHSQLVAKGYVLGMLYNVSWFPGVVLNNFTTNKVYGTLFKIEAVDTVFDVLDAYEGVDKTNAYKSLFVRQLVKVHADDHQCYTAWIYIYNKAVDDLELIPSGDFLKYKTSK